MKILALEFSSPLRSVAVSSGTGQEGYAEEKGGRETMAFGMIESALSQAGLLRNEVECIAIGLGPGSYAGIRIAIAIAQGWQMASGVNLLGISSAEVVAAQAASSGSGQQVLVGLEAQRGQLYVAQYDVASLEQPILIKAFHPSAQADASLNRMDLLTEEKPGAGHPRPAGARMLARIASHRADFVSGSALEPVYLRKADFVKAPVPRFNEL